MRDQSLAKTELPEHIDDGLDRRFVRNGDWGQVKDLAIL